MNGYMNRVALNTFSYFDTGNRPSGEEPERFYHGFVLGLIVDLQNRYIITSNHESGFGRYDVMLEPRDPGKAVCGRTDGSGNTERTDSQLWICLSGEENSDRMSFRIMIIARPS